VLAATGIATLAVLTVALATDAAAQTRAGEWELGAGGMFESYSFSDADNIGIESLTVFTAPFGVGTWIGEKVRLEVRGAFASGTLTDNAGTDYTLSGVTDTEVRASIAVVPDALALDVVGYLPTGTSSLDAEQAVVAAAVAADLLPFHVSQWGTGGAVALALTGTRRFGTVGLGVTASYRASGEYEPFDSDFTYQPGDELRVRVGLDATVGRSSKFSIAAGLRQFSDDVGNDQNLFKTGNRVEIVSTYSFPTGVRGAGALYGALVSREGGTFLDQAGGETAAQALVLFGGLLRLPVGSNHITPRVDGRFFKPDVGPGQGYVVGAGASMDIATSGATIVPNAGVRFGSLEGATGDESSMTGFTAGLTIRFGPGR
jgi:hypothetical protein